MKLPRRITNTGLATLLHGSGFASMEQFATAVNARAWHMHGVKLAHDHISVRRWLAGGTPQNADAVAAVLSDAWGYHIPPDVIWPQLRAGNPPAPAHLQPWAADCTLEGLGFWTRCDMLSRRDLFSSVVVASGAALTDPVARWLTADPGRLVAREEGAGRIDETTVDRIERLAVVFADIDAVESGSVARAAAVGQLKHAVDLASHAGYRDATGNRLLAAIAGLSGLVGWMCTDSAMHHAAQKYFVYGLQAARESMDPRAPALVVSILSDLARHMRLRGHPDTALRLLDLALDQLPRDRQRHHRVRAMLWSQKGWALSCFGISHLPEVRNTLRLARDIHSEAGPDDVEEHRLHRTIDLSASEVAGITSASYLNLAREDRGLAVEAERETLRSLAGQPASHLKNEIFSKIRLASARFVGGEPEQACLDAGHAVEAAERIHDSARISTRLRELVGDAAPYADLPEVRELRDRVLVAVADAGGRSG